MNNIKKIFGAACMIIAPVVIYYLIKLAAENIGGAVKDANKPLPWIIIIIIFTPIAIGLFIFGWYAFKGEYEQLPASSAEIE